MLLRDQCDASKKGWKRIGEGRSKIVYKKGKIVIKFAKPGNGFHLNAEANKYFSIPRYYRRYLVRIFAGDSNKIIQRYVPIKIKEKYSAKEYADFDILIDKLKIGDVSLHRNITISKGKPIIYDFGCEIIWIS